MDINWYRIDMDFYNENAKYDS